MNMTYNEAIEILDKIDMAIRTVDIETADKLFDELHDFDCSAYEQFILDLMIEDMHNRLSMLKWNMKIYNAYSCCY